MYLFLVNGIVEGMAGVSMWMNPSSILGSKHKCDAHGRLYASLLAPMMVTMSFASILINKEPETNTKHLFGVSWMIWHIITASKTIKDAYKGAKMPVIPAIIHTTFAIWFAIYLRNQSFNPIQLVTFK